MVDVTAGFRRVLERAGLRARRTAPGASNDIPLLDMPTDSACVCSQPAPAPADCPLWRMPNVVITPRIARWGGDTHAREWNITRENLRRYVAGEPMLSVIDLSRGY